jgi:pilus assembly protein CpaD
VEAVTNTCGTWNDRFNPSHERNDYYNFGCSSQANFGAMLADPRDLVRPRGVGYPDAGRRAEVLARYRRGEITATQASEDRQAAIVDIEQH